MTEATIGSADSVRDLSFDVLDRLVDDRLVGPLGQTTHRLGYGYDDDGNVTSQTVIASGNSAAGTHGYGYDRAGRLTSWTAPGGTATGYTWDDLRAPSYDTLTTGLSDHAWIVTTVVPAGRRASPGGSSRRHRGWDGDSRTSGVNVVSA